MFTPLHKPPSAHFAPMQPLAQADVAQTPSDGAFASLMQFAGDMQTSSDSTISPASAVLQAEAEKPAKDIAETADGLLQEACLQLSCPEQQPLNQVPTPVLTSDASPTPANAVAEPFEQGHGATLILAASEVPDGHEPATVPPIAPLMDFLPLAASEPAMGGIELANAAPLPAGVGLPLPAASQVSQAAALPDSPVGQGVDFGSAELDGSLPIASAMPPWFKDTQGDDLNTDIRGATEAPRLPATGVPTAAVPSSGFDKPVLGEAAKFDGVNSAEPNQLAAPDVQPARSQSQLPFPTGLTPSPPLSPGVVWVSAALPLTADLAAKPVGAVKVAAADEKPRAEGETARPEPSAKGQLAAVVVVRQAVSPEVEDAPIEGGEPDGQAGESDHLPVTHGAPFRQGPDDLVRAPRQADSQTPVTTDVLPLPVATDLPSGLAPAEAAGLDVATLAPASSGAPTAQAHLMPVGKDGPPHPVRQLAEAIVSQPDGIKPGRIELLLAPDTLGRVHFDIQTDKLGLSITLSAERAETLDLIRRSLPDLVAELRQVGIDGGSFHFGSWNGKRHAPEPILIQPPATETPTPPAFQAQQKLTSQTMGSGGLNMRL